MKKVRGAIRASRCRGLGGANRAGGAYRGYDRLHRKTPQPSPTSPHIRSHTPSTPRSPTPHLSLTLPTSPKPKSPIPSPSSPFPEPKSPTPPPKSPTPPAKSPRPTPIPSPPQPYSPIPPARSPSPSPISSLPSPSSPIPHPLPQSLRPIHQSLHPTHPPLLPTHPPLLPAHPSFCPNPPSLHHIFQHLNLPHLSLHQNPTPLHPVSLTLKPYLVVTSNLNSFTCSPPGLKPPKQPKLPSLSPHLPYPAAQPLRTTWMQSLPPI